MSEIVSIQSLYYGVNKEFVNNSDYLTLSKNGVEEDYHSDNQILMLDMDTFNRMNQDSALCMKRFYANIIYANSMNDHLSKGDSFRKNELLLKITKMGKRCHIDDGCNYLLSHDICPLKENTIYLECLNAGIVKLNDQWEVIKCINTPL